MCDRWLLLLLLLLDGAHGNGGRRRRRREAELLVNLRLRDQSESRRELRVRPPEVVQAHGAGFSKLKELGWGRGRGQKRQHREEVVHACEGFPREIVVANLARPTTNTRVTVPMWRMCVFACALPLSR